MQYMLVFQEPLSEFEKRTDPAVAPAYWGAWNAYIGALGQAGVIVSGHGLEPPHTGTTVRLRDEYGLRRQRHGGSVCCGPRVVPARQGAHPQHERSLPDRVTSIDHHARLAVRHPA